MTEARIRRAGLLDVLGAAGSTNIQGEIQQKLDVYANEALLYSVNEAYATDFPEKYRCSLNRLRNREFGRWYSSRYVGSLVADGCWTDEESSPEYVDPSTERAAAIHPATKS
jgi:fructose-1,6-bisphosphatase